VKRIPRIIRKRNHKTTAVPQPREEPVHIGAGQKVLRKLLQKGEIGRIPDVFQYIETYTTRESLRLNKSSVDRKSSKQK